MKNDKILSLLGLGTKAGKIKSGEFMVEKTVKAGKGKLVIVATDASETSKKSYRDMCRFYHTPILEYGSKDTLGKAIGKEMRAAIVVTDGNFAESIIKKSSEMSTEEGTKQV